MPCRPLFLSHIHKYQGLEIALTPLTPLYREKVYVCLCIPRCQDKLGTEGSTIFCTTNQILMNLHIFGGALGYGQNMEIICAEDWIQLNLQASVALS